MSAKNGKNSPKFEEEMLWMLGGISTNKQVEKEQARSSFNTDVECQIISKQNGQAFNA